MLQKIISMMLCNLLPGVAFGQTVNVQTGAESLRIGGEFRSELIYNDHGLDNSEDRGSGATSNLQVTAAKLKFKGNLSKNTEYAFRFTLVNTDPKSQALEYGYGKHWFGKSLGFTFGKVKVMQGGFDNMDGNYRSHVIPAYRSDLIYESRYETVIGLHLVFAGELSFYVLNDVNTQTNPNRWNDRQSATLIVGYRSKFGPIESLINYGSYDTNKSRWIDVGLKIDMLGLTSTLDYWNDQESLKARKITDDSVRELFQSSSSMTLNVRYSINGVAVPWLHLSKFDKKQPDTGVDAFLLQFDSATNTIAKESSKNRNYNLSSANIDDNAVMGGLGVDVTILGKGWTPYLAFVGTQASFQKKTKSGIEIRKSLQVKLGVLGEI